MNGEDRSVVRILADSSEVESILDPIEAAFGRTTGFHVVVFASEASLPRVPEPEEPLEPTDDAAGQAKRRSMFRVSREELRQDILEGTRLDRVYIAMVALSTVVAATGLARDSAAVVIGAMVIAPLLGPNIAFCLAVTLGDRELAKKALKTGLTGLSISALLSLALGFLLAIDPQGAEIALRTSLSLSDIVLALAAGTAGALAFTTGSNQASLVGVMVAVALLPPLTTSMMLVSGGYFAGAARALLLLAVNLVCVNLAGIATFLAQGIRPRTWYEEAVARKASRRALVAWGMALLILTGLLFLARHFTEE